jgi:tRNA dimethylallyltransferase
VPIISGGTFLWIKALVQGLAPAAPADPAVRARHRELVEAMGRQALHARLVEVDPVVAERLAPNDAVRVSRALEVFELSGKPMSAWHAEHGFRKARYIYRLIGAAQSQADLDARIAARVRDWLAMGWVDEVRDLVARGYDGARAMGSVGYKEVRAHLAGQLPYGELAATIVRSTRVFARRQRTWLRDEPVVWTSR